MQIRVKIFRFYSVFLDRSFFSFLDKFLLLKNRFVFNSSMRIR
ncbi:hypothetical protein LEP1GSC064_3733 [Leptospira kirschneri serovar Grippotyphosa str. Moskva]|nr:hypothetical protein LEP1GSC044_1596 [Leptospira kirschneri serovar Grippotyphosa str. RM52]EKP04739.1 hypothetical protein LEP1GSC018_0808 [Leptospira kirschneri str. 2008720114]EKQ83848.1 hypothetical protein LEP1GSC064_3733 [Leptospira kirschneri serovar Grippotyphosa str. Moskva]EKR10372.1 hypothetical protein LEP1GSC122_3909 [Leptospira kirschneri serovar Valbuzzi str. 200702274]EMK07098.1 hypothetical protein LEP1GSC176_3412 [Leptospira kirschneri str. MMD1493]EMK18746.1 hypothetical 